MLSLVDTLILESMESNKVMSLSTFGRLQTRNLVEMGKLLKQFQMSSGLFNASSLSDHLKCKVNEIENFLLLYIKQINVMKINDPHFIILRLQQIQNAVITSPNLT